MLPYVKAFNSKVQGGILSSVLAISLILVTLSTSLILLAYYYRVSYIARTTQLKVIHNAESGINYLLAHEPGIGEYTTTVKDLFGLGIDSVELTKKPWGFFDIGIAKAQSGRHYALKIGLMGSFINSNEQVALYLADHGMSLTLSGDTEIRGECYLPKNGVRSGRATGRAYSGSDLIYGQKKESKITLPDISHRIINNVENLIAAQGMDELIYSKELEDKMFFSFGNPTRYFYQKEPLVLSQQIKGNIILRSDTEIRISARADLDQIILVAPKIYVEDYFKGRLQLIAEDSIIVGKNCIFSYPTVIAVSGKSDRSLISINEKTEISGMVYLNNEIGSYETKLLQISEGVKITGQVYASSMVEHKGAIYGNISCDSFFYRGDNIYLNHLHDAVIDVSKRPEIFVGVTLDQTSGKNGIIEWLH